MENFSFSQYLASKVQLKKALTETPYKIAKYRVTKYCKLELSEGDESLSLKPSNELIVEWTYEDKDNPTIQTVIAMTKDGSANISVKRNSIKLAKWLASNTEQVD